MRDAGFSGVTARAPSLMAVFEQIIREGYIPIGRAAGLPLWQIMEEMDGRMQQCAPEDEERAVYAGMFHNRGISKTLDEWAAFVAGFEIGQELSNALCVAFVDRPSSATHLLLVICRVKKDGTLAPFSGAISELNQSRA